MVSRAIPLSARAVVVAGSGPSPAFHCRAPCGLSARVVAMAGAGGEASTRETFFAATGVKVFWGEVSAAGAVRDAARAAPAFGDKIAGRETVSTVSRSASAFRL